MQAVYCVHCGEKAVCLFMLPISFNEYQHTFSYCFVSLLVHKEMNKKEKLEN